MALSWPFKDPDEILDFDIDWTSRLLSADELEDGVTTPTDAIATSTFTLSAGSLTKGVDTYSSTRTKVWLSGGEEGESYQILNRITTTGGRTMDQTVKLKIKGK